VARICGFVELGLRLPDAAVALEMVGGMALPDGAPAATLVCGSAVVCRASAGRAGGEDIAEGPNGCVLVADAVLDNRSELLARLRGSAPHLSSASTDEHILLAAYLHWGDGFVQRLLGDFALAVYDPDRGVTLLARDSMGMRPLYYGRGTHVALFASEAAAMLRHPAVRPGLDLSEAADLMVGRCGGRTTLFRDICPVPPGGLVMLRDEADAERIGMARPALSAPASGPAGLADALRRLLEEAVAERIPARGRAAILVSGGLDSSSIAVLAHGLARNGQASAPVGIQNVFSGMPACDERVWTQPLVDMGIALRHVEACDHLLPGSPELEQTLEGPCLGWEGIAHAQCELVRQCGAEVVLTGDCAAHHWVAARDAAARALVEGRLGALSWQVRDLHSLARLLRPGLVEPLMHDLRLATGRARVSLPSWLDRGFAEQSGLIDRLRDDQRPRVVGRRPEHVAGLAGSVGRAITWRNRHFSRLGVDLRCPLMDTRVIDFLHSLPVTDVHAACEDRVILRRAMAGLLPDSLRTRTAKAVFLPYMEHGLRTHGEAMLEAFRAPLLADLGAVDAGRLTAAAQAFLGGSRKGYDLWMPLTLERWLRRHGDELRNITP
jgi:asparagine synthase (glutamine-hydrolysing)